MTSHCRHCGSAKCNHGNCPECSPCTHCDGGDRRDKFFGYGEDGYPIDREDDPRRDAK